MRVPNTERHHLLRDGPRRLSLPSALVVVAAFGAAGLLLACRSQPTERQPPRFVYSLFEGTSTSFYVATAGQPDGGTLLARLEHAEHYSGRAALSPDGRSLATTNLPPKERETEGRADLYVLPLAGGEPLLLYHGVDLAARPLWSPDGASILVRSTERSQDAAVIRLLLVDSGDGSATTLASDNEALGLYPIGWASDGSSAFYARIDATGTSLLSADRSGSEALVLAHISGGVARDFALSPDGTRIAFVAPTESGTELAAVEVATGERLTYLDSPRTLLHPLWHAGDKLSFGIGGDQPTAVTSISAHGVQALAAPLPVSGFDVPLAFSAKGDYLAATHYEGSSPDVTSAEVVILSTHRGSRWTLGRQGVYAFIGWLP